MGGSRKPCDGLSPGRLANRPCNDLSCAVIRYHSSIRAVEGWRKRWRTLGSAAPMPRMPWAAGYSISPRQGRYFAAIMVSRRRYDRLNLRFPDGASNQPNTVADPAAFRPPRAISGLVGDLRCKPATDWRPSRYRTQARRLSNEVGVNAGGPVSIHVIAGAARGRALNRTSRPAASSHSARRRQA